MLKIVAAVGSTLAVALAAALPGSAMRIPARPHVQQVNMTFLRGDRVLEGNIALAPGVPVRITVTNYTRAFHTFTVPGLHVSELVLPAHQNGPTRTTFTFTPNTSGLFAWHCAICPSGIHGKRHDMSGTLYVIVSPSAVP
jgi:heme/copper-type cytochrome/quinol oxidase subunit 2